MGVESEMGWKGEGEDEGGRGGGGRRKVMRGGVITAKSRRMDHLFSTPLSPHIQGYLRAREKFAGPQPPPPLRKSLSQSFSFIPAHSSFTITRSTLIHSIDTKFRLFEQSVSIVSREKFMKGTQAHAIDLSTRVGRNPSVPLHHHPPHLPAVPVPAAAPAAASAEPAEAEHHRTCSNC